MIQGRVLGMIFYKFLPKQDQQVLAGVLTNEKVTKKMNQSAEVTPSKFVHITLYAEVQCPNKETKVVFLIVLIIKKNAHESFL